MARFSHSMVLDGAQLARRREPRDDIVAEVQRDAGTYDIAEGPFASYRRVLEVSPGADEGTYAVTETFDYHLQVGPWRLLFDLPVRRALRAGPRTRSPWWVPPDRLDPRAVRVLAMLCTLSLLDGYLGTVISQTMTFAAEEFGAGDREQGVVLAWVRIGVLLSVVLTSAADRHGRRGMLGFCAVAATALTLVGAVTPGMVTLGISQAAARGIATAFGILLIIIASEELPPRSRAYGFSVIVLSAGLGAGFAVWLLPLADLGPRAWRLLYVAPVVVLPLLWPVWRAIPETTRFTRTREQHETGSIDRRRFALLGIIGFLLAAFSTPASQFQNEFLRDDRGFSAGGITLFTLVTTTPAGLGIFAGGLVADLRGRRRIAAVGAVGGSVLVALAYNASGSAMWALMLAGSVLGAVIVPALGVYGPELFGTSVRGSANGWIRLVTVAGAATGLVAVGWMSESLDGFGGAFALMAVAPLVVAVIVLLRLPETTGQTLEELNPPRT